VIFDVVCDRCLDDNPAAQAHHAERMIHQLISSNLTPALKLVPATGIAIPWRDTAVGWHGDHGLVAVGWLARCCRN
jgi:hypothetical protein